METSSNGYWQGMLRGFSRLMIVTLAFALSTPKAHAAYPGDTPETFGKYCNDLVKIFNQKSSISGEGDQSSPAQIFQAGICFGTINAYIQANVSFRPSRQVDDFDPYGRCYPKPGSVEHVARRISGWSQSRDNFLSNLFPQYFQPDKYPKSFSDVHMLMRWAFCGE
jgi:hypothetical protein